jgi:hypothetical protein
MRVGWLLFKAHPARPARCLPAARSDRNPTTALPVWLAAEPLRCSPLTQAALPPAAGSHWYETLNRFHSQIPSRQQGLQVLRVHREAQCAAFLAGSERQSRIRKWCSSNLPSIASLTADLKAAWQAAAACKWWSVIQCANTAFEYASWQTFFRLCLTLHRHVCNQFRDAMCKSQDSNWSAYQQRKLLGQHLPVQAFNPNMQHGVAIRRVFSPAD